MNRIPKFRKWDNGVMTYSHTNNINNSNFQLKFFFERITENCIIMQFSDFKDDELNDIYEGDILMVNGKYEYTVIFSNGCFKIKDSSNTIVNTLEALFDNLTDESLLVVGHIYENPELKHD